MYKVFQTQATAIYLIGTDYLTIAESKIDRNLPKRRNKIRGMKAEEIFTIRILTKISQKNLSVQYVLVRRTH